MITAYSLVYDLFMQQIKDWKLDALYDTDVDDFETYLQGFLVLAIPFFSDFCDQSLAHNNGTALFTETLTEENIVILSKMMVKEWLKKETDDIRQINLKLNDSKAFKTYSEAQNLREKSNRLIQIEEEISQMITGYSWYNNDWDSWIAGTFYESSS